MASHSLCWPYRERSQKVLYTLIEASQDLHEDDESHGVIRIMTRRAGRVLENLQFLLKNDDDPLTPPEKKIKLDKQIVGRYIDVRDVKITYQQLSNAPSRFHYLYGRLLGVLSRVAQNVETVIGLSPLQAPESKKEEVAKEKQKQPV